MLKRFKRAVGSTAFAAGVLALHRQPKLKRELEEAFSCKNTDDFHREVVENLAATGVPRFVGWFLVGLTGRGEK